MQKEEKEKNWGRNYIILLILNVLMIIGLVIFQNYYA